MSQTPVSLRLLTPVQSAMRAQGRRYNAIVGGKWSGLTQLGVDVLLASANGAIYGCSVAFIAANADELRKAKRRILRAVDRIVKGRPNRTRLELTTGGRIDFYCADDPAFDLWEQYHLVVVDDAGDIDRLRDVWEDMVRPSLSRHNGHAWLLSHARGGRNPFARLWQEADTDPLWFAGRMFSVDNPHVFDRLTGVRENVSDLVWRQDYEGEFLEGVSLTASQQIIGANETFRQWCERLGKDGLKVDGHPFKLDDRPAMAWIYDQVPSTIDEAYRLVLVLMKCAQVGFTVMEMLATIYLGLKFGPATVGMFLPDMGLADIKSSKRFMPVVRTIPSVHKLMTMDAPDGSGRKGGEGNTRVRQIGEAMFVFSWTSGRATTESIPMSILSYDEVQEMTLEQMEKTQERLSASEIRFTLMGSTANWPDADIHHWYKRGSQRRFHTECPTCGSKKPLDEYFPACIKFDEEVNRYRYVCPDGHWLDDPQRGEWVADNPEADPPIDLSIPKKERPMRIRSIHFPQFLSPTISAEEIIFAYNTATDMKNFYNRKLGKPYLDPSQVPVTLEHLANCVKAGRAAGIVWKARATGTYMGIDQMGNFNVHVIKERLPDGRQAVIYVEETYSADPFERSSELMEQYGVSVCVVEINPNYNDAKKFANRHPGKVFICDSFGSMKEGMIQWGDGPRLDASDRRTDEEARDRYTLRMDQFKCMQVSMARFTSATPMCLFPDPQGLVQEVREKGVTQAVAVLPRAFHHFTKTALVVEKDDETNKYRRVVKKIGIDPHFSYANMLCDVAWARAHGTSSFIIPDVATSADEVRLQAVERSMPGLPGQVMGMMQQATAGTCGSCVSFSGGMCEERGFVVQAADLACGLYLPDEN